MGHPLTRHVRLAILLAIAMALLTAGALAASEDGENNEVERYTPVKPRVVDHTEYFREAGISKYRGSATCIACHRDEVEQFFHSYHYQMASRVSDIAGKGSILFGGRVAYNDFCMAMFLNNGTKPLNWIGYVVLKKTPPGYENLANSFTGLTGCSMCHGVTMGLPPSWKESPEQLGNIDCLACHADPNVYLSGAKGIALGMKNVTKDSQGRWVYEVKVDINKLASSIIDVPFKENCLACHAFSGGGPHLKRPNLGPDMYTGKTGDGEIFDVHIASGLSCVDCHPGRHHKFSTSSVDTWDRGGSRPDETTKSCTSCHGEKPHKGLKGSIINRFHLEKVACQTCHIPYIADGDYPTELYRDWSASTFHPDKKRWKFSIPDPETGDVSEWHLVGKMKPVYTWYNGTREVYVFPERATPASGSNLELDPINGESAGVIYYARPLGDKNDPDSKIYPFKLHRAVIPYSKVNQTPVPLKVGIAFATGNVKLAANVGAKAAGLSWDNTTYVTYVRYMQVNHGVKPAEEALSCLDCHGPTIRRMPWPELGYGHYPEIAFTSIIVAVIVLVVGLSWYLIRKRGLLFGQG